MFVDIPPGTEGVPSIIFQFLPVDGTTTVTSPQELVSIIVAKVVNMVEKMGILAMRIVENISYLECSDYDKRISVFGEGHMEEIAKEHSVQVLTQIPVDPRIAQMVDAGRVGCMEMPWFEYAAEVVETL